MSDHSTLYIATIVKSGPFCVHGFLQIPSSARLRCRTGITSVAGAGIRHDATFNCFSARANVGVSTLKQTTAGRLSAVTTECNCHIPLSSVSWSDEKAQVTNCKSNQGLFVSTVFYKYLPANNVCHTETNPPQQHASDMTYDALCNCC